MELCSLYGKGGLSNGVFRKGKIVSLEKVDGGFEAVDEDGNKVKARKVVLATGIKDILPLIPGMSRTHEEELMGRITRSMG